MAAYTVDLVDLPRLLDKFRQDATKLDFTPALRRVALYLAAQAQLCFDEQRSPDGVPWVGWKHPPSARRGGPSAKLLRDTDLLMGSLVGRGRDHVEDVTRASLLWGTNLPYASYHQHGTRHLPARPFIGLTPAMQERVQDILIDWLTEKLLRGPA